jgi:predicted nucleic acid-binding protein
MTRYLLDTNIFIEAKNRYYGFDFCPAFWEWLIERNAGGRVASIDKVGDELQAGGDDLSDWATTRGRAFFLPPDDPVVPALTRVSSWATGQNYEAAAIATFLQVADYWLVAHALAHDFVVVTHELPSDSTRKIKIPNVCIGLGIECINPYAMLRRERARFVLGPAPRAA